MEQRQAVDRVSTKNFQILSFVCPEISELSSAWIPSDILQPHAQSSSKEERATMASFKSIFLLAPIFSVALSVNAQNLR